MRFRYRCSFALIAIFAIACGDDDAKPDASAGGGGSGGGSTAPACLPAYRALTLAIVGDQKCTELEQCIMASCSSELGEAVGASFQEGDYSGGICDDYVVCVELCDCESTCSRSCREAHASSGACLDAAIAVSLCRNDACPAAADSCTDL
jgi:hypothetical protein